MKREEVAKRMRESIINHDKELLYDTYNALYLSIHHFVNHEIGLKAHYPELSFRRQGGIDVFEFKENALTIRFSQEENKIIVSKRTKKDEKLLDEITSDNGKLICHEGEFIINEIDDYLSRCFAKLLK
ncbi:hypothetical protein [Metabacillus idriensis]|uniref:hypothetical protein n=1 Tax=Metabacillus idriensis TaxID=324768 RepID=UPI00174C1B79|nr:hypothetical protein [Metabacillus idriensis]